MATTDSTSQLNRHLVSKPKLHRSIRFDVTGRSLKVAWGIHEVLLEQKIVSIAAAMSRTTERANASG